MKPKRTKNTVPAHPPLTEISGGDRDVLTHAYKTGLIGELWGR